VARTSAGDIRDRYMYCRPSARWLTSPRCSSRTSIVATVVSASRRPVIARWTSVTDASSRDQSTCMTVSCDAVSRGGAAGFRGMLEYYTSRRRTASQGRSEFDGHAQGQYRRPERSVRVLFDVRTAHGPLVNEIGGWRDSAGVRQSVEFQGAIRSFVLSKSPFDIQVHV